MNLLKKICPSGPKEMRVIKYGNPILRETSKPIDEVTKDVRTLAGRMVVSMLGNEIEGVGLAAPQVGVNLRLITLATHDPSLPMAPNASPGELLLGPRMPLALVNPEIVSFSEFIEGGVEGCLSIPEVNGVVDRPVSVRFRAQTLDGEVIDVECGGLLGRCLQHEIDHLDGILFVDRISDEECEEAEPILRSIERQEKRHLRKKRVGAGSPSEGA